MAIRAVLILFLSVLTFGNAAMAKPDIEINSSQSPDPITNTHSLQVHITWPQSEGSYSFGLPEPQYQGMKLLKKGESEESLVKGGVAYTRKTFSLTFEGIGEKKGLLKGYSISYMDPTNQLGGSLPVDTQRFEFSTSAGRPIGVVIIGIVILLFIGGPLVFFLIQKKRKANKTNEESETLRADHALLKQLEEIVEEREQKSQQDLITDWEGFFKEFINTHYDFKPKDRSKESYLEIIESADLSKKEKNEITKVLDELDHAKYSGSSLSETELKSLRNQVTDFAESRGIVRNS